MIQDPWPAAYKWARQFATALGGIESEAEALALLLRYGAGLSIRDINELTWAELSLELRLLKRKTVERPLSQRMVETMLQCRKYKKGPTVFHVNGRQWDRTSVSELVQRPLNTGKQIPVDTLVRATLGLDIEQIRRDQKHAVEVGNRLVQTIARQLRPLCTDEAARSILNDIEAEGQKSYPNVVVVERALQKLQVQSRNQSSPRKLRKLLFDMLYDRDYWMRRKLAEKDHNPLSMYRYGPTQVKHYSVSAVGLFPYRN